MIKFENVNVTMQGKRILSDINLEIQDGEFVLICGESGCGKTTMLNIIGGLDRYTSGDLVINGKSTKQFKDKDWDTYRNHSVGFVFQSYNLIPHQTVLANVELALTISGVGKEERRKEREERSSCQKKGRSKSEESGGSGGKGCGEEKEKGGKESGKRRKNHSGKNHRG